MTTRINHVSVSARGLQESVDFYVELLEENMRGRLFVPD
jgi:catechol 2,3-dioxygenase-like lactoylglutathione lyase family enzyme